MSFRSKPAARTIICDTSQSRFTFRADSAGCKFAIGINAFLSGNVQRIAGDHSIAEGKIRRSGELDHPPFFSGAGQRSGVNKQHKDKQCENRSVPTDKLDFPVFISCQLLFCCVKNSRFTFTRQEC